MSSDDRSLKWAVADVQPLKRGRGCAFLRFEVFTCKNVDVETWLC